MSSPAVRSVVVHGHFYQPPREDPWREVVEPEPSAAPFADWNVRVAHECYEPFAAARVLDAQGHVLATMNLFEWTSFNVTPVLMRWLERETPAVYAAILDADRASAARLGGHGNAIASPFHHVILPLASRRDKETEVRWGLADFRRRFGREAEGMWLPETAVDEETLVVLAEQGVKFTIVAPHQLERLPLSGAPARFVAGGGREIAVFAYDGRLSNDAAFGSLLSDGAHFAAAIAPDPAHAPILRGPGIVSLALDGETFGHHHKFAEMAWANAVRILNAQRGVTIENFASVLAGNPATTPAVIVGPSSWSCPHGVERWTADCACGITPGASHAWRRPLRAALNWLARELDARYETRASLLFDDAWAERDAFGAVAALSRDARKAYVVGRLRDAAGVDEAFDILDGQRARLGMFSSCAWFFDKADGHETVLMLRLAALVLDLLGDAGLEEEFIARLALARSDATSGPSTADAYREHVLPMRQRARSK